MKMSLISMVSMELGMTAMDMHLTQGVVAVGELWWWQAIGASMGVGFLVPLPYNYYMLKKYRKACH